MRRASTAYRSLLWRLLENLELITLLGHRSSSSLSSQEWPNNTMLLEASRLASDSRVPKSSSVPARLSNQKPNCTYNENNHINSAHFACSNNAQLLKRSRIPLLSQRVVRTKSSVEACSNRSSRSSSGECKVTSTDTSHQLHSRGFVDPGFCLALAIDDFSEPGMLHVTRGERLRILTRRGQLARCCRLQPRHDRVSQGLVPTSNLTVDGF